MLNNLNVIIRSFRKGYQPFPYKKYMHKHKLIFIHIPRTGGTSITRFFTDEKIARDHSTWVQYKLACNWAFENYTKFAVVRNPWDRVASAYKYFKQGGNQKGDLVYKEYVDSFTGFNDFVKNGLENLKNTNIQMLLPQTFFICHYDTIVVDYLLRFEHLSEDLRKIDVLKNIELKKINASSEERYIDLYNEDSKNIVSRLYAYDIHKLEYNFSE